LPRKPPRPLSRSSPGRRRRRRMAASSGGCCGASPVADRAQDGPIVILTGAGISKESGLDTFRDADGIWARHRIEDVATPEAFARDPRRVYDFYNQRRRNLLASQIQPN